MAKQINIDWEPKGMTSKGACTGIGCPIRTQCVTWVKSGAEHDMHFGYLIPPHDSSGQFPKYCRNFLSNQPHRPAIRTVEIQD